MHEVPFHVDLDHFLEKKIDDETGSTGHSSGMRWINGNQNPSPAVSLHDSRKDQKAEKPGSTS